ncbi:MAG TPA: cellulase family glycosylhydrolase, partial [Cellvibrio sp.]|nr:cellulase family glycosylhydrolase [Cellvibrio sp.]
MNNKFFGRIASGKRATYQRKITLTTRLKITALAGIGLLSSIAMADVAPLSVSGNKILASDKVASFAGNSLFWSNNGWGGEKYYNADAVRWLKTDWGSNLVRVAMGVEEGGGYLQDPTGNKNKVKAVVDAAIANDMYVIIDWHTHHAEQFTSQSIAFFQEMARTYGNKNHVIYEVYNEPLDTASWSGVIKPYAQQVVNAIRAIDPDNLIIVGTRTWSQRVDEASRDPIAGKNIAYTLHFYAGSHGQSIRDFAQTALNNNAAIFVTEWGSVNANGDGGVNYGETNAWVDFMKRNNISHANWALNDKAEGSSALVPGASANGGWASSQLTASGAFAKDIIRNWPQVDGGDGGNCTTAGLGETIQAENYCQADGIQTESTSDAGGGQNVGYIDSSDWMTYSINLPAT